MDGLFCAPAGLFYLNRTCTQTIRRCLWGEDAACVTLVIALPLIVFIINQLQFWKGVLFITTCFKLYNIICF